MCHASTLHPSHARPLAVQEFALLFAVFDETKSWYCAENLDRKCRPPRGTPAGDPAWREEYRFHAVNGYVADALLGLVMAEGRRTRWHLLSMGDPGHAQSVHFSAHSVTVRDGGEHRTAVCNLYPGNNPCSFRSPKSCSQLWRCCRPEQGSGGWRAWWASTYGLG